MVPSEMKAETTRMLCLRPSGASGPLLAVLGVGLGLEDVGRSCGGAPSAGVPWRTRRSLPPMTNKPGLYVDFGS